MSKRTTTLALAIMLGLVACSSDKSNDDTPASLAPTPEQAPSQPAPVEPNPAVDSKPIPLLAWVDDLIDHHTNDEAVPDTVDDKNIEANEDPAAFDKYLQ